MRTWLAIVGCMLGCLLGPAQSGARQVTAAYFGRPVTEVRFEVDGRPDASPALASVVDVKPGVPLTRDAVRASMDRLFSLGRYEDIRPTVFSAADGVAVTFRLVARYPISRVEIEAGDVGVSPGALRTELQQRFGGVPTGVRNEAVADVARRFLNDEGYLDADATAETRVDREARQATLVVAVRAGARAVIRHARVIGNATLRADDVLKRAGAAVGQPYRRRAIDTALTDIEDGLRTKGYYEAQATLSATTFADGVDVVIAIDAGPRVDLRVEPDTRLLPGRVDDLIPIRRQRSADQDLLEDAQQAILRGLRRDGYADATVSFTRELSADRTLLTVTYRLSRGARYHIDHVELPGQLALTPETLRTLVNINPGDVFDPDRVTAALARVVEEYRRRGYHAVRVEASRETVNRGVAGQVWVTIHPVVTEGPRGEIRSLTFTFSGDHAVGEDSLRASMRSKVGEPFTSLDAALDQAALLQRYREDGYLNAVVGIDTTFSDGGRAVALGVKITEGPRVIVSRITVVGNQRITEARILEAIHGALDVGQPLAASGIAGARQRLAALGIFRRVLVVPDERLSGETDARIVISVIEAPDTTVAFGGGVEGASIAVQTTDGVFDDRVEFAPRGTFEIGRRNLGGKNRSINFYSRVSLRRKDKEQPTTDTKGFGFTEYRVTTTYREQRAFRTDTDLLVGLTSEQGIRSTYKFLRRSATAEALHRLGPHVSASGRYALDFTRLFDERVDVNDQPLIDRLFPQVRLSYFSTGLTWEGRDNPLAATRGTLASADVELSGRAIGSEVGYVKTFVQGARYFRVRGTPDTVLAMRAQLGLARGFERTVTSVDLTGTPRTDIVSDLPISQRFFAGGSTSVRGFQVDRLGIYDPECVGTACSVIDKVTGLSLGGNGLVVLNAELRRRVFKKVSGAMFLDGGNVYAKASDIDLSRLRGAAGLGVRIDSPLGSIRLDFGFKLNRRTIAAGRESAWEYHLSFGEAF